MIKAFIMLLLTFSCQAIPLSFGVGTVLHPTFHAPDAFTDLAHINLSDGTLLDVAPRDLIYQGIAVNAGGGELYLHKIYNGSAETSAIDVLDAFSFKTLRSFDLGPWVVEDYHYSSHLRSLVGNAHTNTDATSIIRIDVKSGAVLTLATYLRMSTPHTEGALDDDGGRYFFPSDDRRECASLNVFALNNGNRNLTSFPLCNLDFAPHPLRNLQYNPNDGMLYYTPNSVVIAAIDPATGIVKPLFNLSNEVGSDVNIYHDSSFFAVAENAYWVQSFNSHNGNVFFVKVTFSPLALHVMKNDGRTIFLQAAYCLCR